MFRPSDVRRVQAIFDDQVYAPYEAEVTLEDYRGTMRVKVMDPDDATLTVAQAIWHYDPAALRGRKQPDDAEAREIAAQFLAICDTYPARKAADALEAAERAARQAANLAARQADAEA